MKNNNILIVGSGIIGQEYSKIFTTLGIDVTIIQRSKNIEFKNNKLSKIKDDLYDLPVSTIKKYSHIIVAVQPRNSFEVVNYLLNNTNADILVEKPLALSSQEIKLFDEMIFNQRIYIAFNRRNFESTILIKEKLDKSKLLSVNVCVTELEDRIIGHATEKEKWGICNTIHMFDLVFYLTGMPKNYDIYRKVSDGKNFIQLYSSSGDHFLNISSGGAGNWGIDFTTTDEKYFMRPIETLKIQKLNSVELTDISLNYDEYKPGFLHQSKKFLEKDRNAFPKFAYYLELTNFIEKFYKY